MKQLFSFLILFSFVLNSIQAQTTLTTAVDFSITDRFGEEHNLYEILGSGKYVLIDFFAHYCQPCCDIAPDINKLYYNYGCNQSQVHILSIEGAGTLAQLESFEDFCGGTSDKPVVTGIEGNGTDVAGEYQLGFYPTVIIIAPDKEIVETDIWPFSYQVAKTKLESYGVMPASCPLPDAINEVSGISALKLAPNPATDNTTLEFNLNESSFCHIHLMDVTGKTIKTVFQDFRRAGINSIDINIQEIPTGSYFVKIETEKSIPQIAKLAITQ